MNCATKMMKCAAKIVMCAAKIVKCAMKIIKCAAKIIVCRENHKMCRENILMFQVCHGWKNFEKHCLNSPKTGNVASIGSVKISCCTLYIIVATNTNVAKYDIIK